MAIDAGTAAAHGRLHALADRIIDWWKNGPRRSDLDGISSAEVARMAQDLGISADDLTRLASRDSDAGLLLYERLTRLGLTREDIEKAGFQRDLERTCGLCDAQEVCRHDMDMRPDDDGWKSYCPNCTSLETLQTLKAATKDKCCG